MTGLIGQSINNYEIRAQIGEGGTGTVYVAEHCFMARKAAVKVLRRTYVQDEWMVALFMNEARAANAIGHPNIIDIIDVGRLPDGQPYLMMEFLAGESLAQRIGRIHRLPIADALDFAAQAAGALAVAHDKGIVHRDLKPENLFLIPDLTMPGGERVKVLDFGTAKLRGDPAPDGALCGSPVYMAPEQCQEDSRIDHRADIYALGALLYHALCGVPPFASESVAELLAMHLGAEPPRPRSIEREIPEGVESVILRALAKRADDRFPSMMSFLAALRASTRGARLAQGAFEVPRVSAFEAFETAARRRPSALGVATAAAACAVAGIVLWTKLGVAGWTFLPPRAPTVVTSPAPSASPIIVPLPTPSPPPPRPRRLASAPLPPDDLWDRRH